MYILIRLRLIHTSLLVVMRIVQILFIITNVAHILPVKRNFWDIAIVDIANTGNFIRFDGNGPTKGNFKGEYINPDDMQFEFHDRGTDFEVHEKQLQKPLPQPQRLKAIPFDEYRESLLDIRQNFTFKCLVQRCF